MIILSVLLLFGANPVLGDQRTSEDRTLQESLLIEGIYEDTAFTLNQGEWKIGELSIPGSLYQWKWAYMQYGLTDNLQIGTTLVRNFQGFPNLSGKFHLPLQGFDELELAIPAKINFVLSPFNVVTTTGLAASWRINDNINFHTGTNLWLTSYGVGFSHPSLYVMAGYRIFSNITLLGELELGSLGNRYLAIRWGGLWRVLETLNFKLHSSLSVPTGGLNAGVDIFARF